MVSVRKQVYLNTRYGRIKFVRVSVYEYLIDSIQKISAGEELPSYSKYSKTTDKTL